MLFSKKPSQWTAYTKSLADTDLTAGVYSKDRLAYLNVNSETLENVREAAKFIRPHLDEMIEDFYQNLLAVDHLNNIITTHSTVEQLKAAQKQYLEEFLSADITDDYVNSRINIGVVHSKINLTSNHFIMAHDKLIQYMTTIIIQNAHRQPDKMIQLVLSVQKLGAFDKQLITSLYMESTMRHYLESMSNMMNNITELNMTKDLLEGMEQQIDETHSVKSATEEMSASIQDVADHATKVAENTEQAVTSVKDSQHIIDNALNEIEQVGKVFDDVTKDVNHLDKEIENTHDVINVIKDIAEQTNLLALNASIEAARAGESGKGFAVVATEVRKLSEHTQEQIEHITTNMNTLQNVSSQVTALIEQTGTNVNESVEGAHASGKELDKIVQTMQEINDATSQIAAMSEEQSATVNEISDRNTTMYDVSENVYQIAKNAADSIYALSERMNQYRLSFAKTNIIFRQKDLLVLAKTDHLLWKWNIYNLLLGIGNISTNNFTTHHECRLGKWYYSEQTKNIRHLDAFKQLEEPHKEVHRLAQLAADCHEKGETDAAQVALTQLEAASNKVVACIEALEHEVVN